jgi:ribosomal protein S18 acetylase RimI-like enzyme
MIFLETINDPMSNESLENQKSIMNSDTFFNQVSIDKQFLTDEDIIEYNTENLKLGAKYFWIKNDKNSLPIGFIQYLPKNPHDGITWIGLLVIHLEHQRNGLGSDSLSLLEELLVKQKIDRVRLCVQTDNNKGVSFWEKKGFKKINSTTLNNKQNDIYEKVLV